MDKLHIIKIGGNVLDDEITLQHFLKKLSALPGNKILVHGGGKIASRIGDQLGIQSKYIDGRRITDEATLDLVTMVYAGLINKKIVASLQALGCMAMGLSGADGNLLKAHKRINSKIDYGFAGDMDEVNANLAFQLIQEGLTLVIAPITHDSKGQLLNTNADTIAQELAKALCKRYHVSLIYTFEKKGVLLNVDDENSVITSIDPSSYEKLKEENKIFAGMIPKLDNAFTALKEGVQKVIIGKAEDLELLTTGQAGTTISHE